MQRGRQYLDEVSLVRVKQIIRPFKDCAHFQKKLKKHVYSSKKKLSVIRALELQ